MTNEAELILDLNNIGVQISSIWDLVNGPNDYDHALPVLLKHLQSTTNSKLKEGIVRALGVKGFDSACEPLIKEYRKVDSKVDKWAIGNTLSIIATKEVLDDLIEIMDDESYGANRQMIANALGRIGSQKSIPVLIKSLEDASVRGHAVGALGKIADDSITIEKIQPFLKHKMRWIRKAAKVAIDRIKKRQQGK
jgi:HEAT repeat protein